MKKFIITAVMAILFVGFASTANAQDKKDDSKKYEPTLTAFEQTVTEAAGIYNQLNELQGKAQDVTGKNSVKKDIDQLSAKFTKLVNKAVAYRDGTEGKPALKRDELNKNQTKRFDLACDDLDKLLKK